jgi:cyanate lyase
MTFFVILLVLIIANGVVGSSGVCGSTKEALVERLLGAKTTSGKTFDEIAKALGVTNAYAAQLFVNQAQLKPNTVDKLKTVVPGINEEDLKLMQRAPMRSFDPSIMQEPLIYRLVEAMQHYGEGIKHLVNEKFGDGIMSAIDIFVDMTEVTGVSGERRIALTLNGKYLPHIEQEAAKNTAAVSQR